jgi:ribosome-associated protein
MIRINETLSIDDGELRYTFSRSPGPGGQNVNKVASRVTLSWDLAQSRCLSGDQRARLSSKLARRITGDGVLRVTSSRHRTQAANRREVLQRFADLLAEALRPAKPRTKTRPTAASQDRRLTEKRRRSRQKAERRGRGGPDDE